MRRFQTIETKGAVGPYVHMGRIGVLLELEGGNPELARDLAMQVAATSPRYVGPEHVPQDVLAKEREILSAQAAQEGKPPEIVAKMVEGRLKKHLEEITLTGQPFVKDPDKRVRDLLAASKAKVKAFLRYEVGEGIEKKASDFVAGGHGAGLAEPLIYNGFVVPLTVRRRTARGSWRKARPRIGESCSS